jgi:hypothetical protein
MMIHRQDNPYHSPRLPGVWRKAYTVPALAGVVLLVLLVVVALTSEGDIAISRMLGVGVIFGLMGLAWLDNRADTWRKERPWRDVANRAGITCHVQQGTFGSSVYVDGNYRGRMLTMYTRKQGKGHVQSTRIGVALNNRSRAQLKLRGPFGQEAAAYDSVTSNLFQSTRARPFGDKRRFFIRSQPAHLGESLSEAGPLWDRLLQLAPLVTIELEGQTLIFEQLGVLDDADYLRELFDLLVDLADGIELRMAPGEVHLR